MGGQGYCRVWTSVSEARSGKTAAGCSSGQKATSMSGSMEPGGRMLSLAMVAWMELMGMSPPRTMSCWDSCRE